MSEPVASRPGRVTRRGAVLLALVLAGACHRGDRGTSDDLAAWGPGSAPDDPATAATILRLRIVAAALEAYGIENNRYPAGDDAGSLASALVPTHVSRLPLRDGWDRALRFRIEEGDYTLASGGADGDASEGDDVTLRSRGDLELPKLPATSALARSIAQAQVAAMAAAIQSYAIDNNGYPVARRRRLASVASLLEPTYIARVPASDPWGGPYELVGDATSFHVASRGGDGRVDGEDARRSGRGDDVVMPGPEPERAASPARGSLAAIDGANDVALGDDARGPDLVAASAFVLRHPQARRLQSGWRVEGHALGFERGELARLEPIVMTCATERLDGDDALRIVLPSDLPAPGVYALVHGAPAAPSGSFGVGLRAPVLAAARAAHDGGESADADVLARRALRCGATPGDVDGLLLPDVHAASRKREMGDMRTIATALESWAVDGGSYPATDGPVAVEQLAPLLSRYAHGLVFRDAWNHPLLYSGSKETFRIVSVGRDDVIGSDSFSPALEPRATTSPDEDLVYDSGSFVRWTESARDGLSPRADFAMLRDLLVPEERRLLETRRALDLIATALASYAIDANAYPAFARGPAAGLAPSLEPTYIAHVPRRDGWDEVIEAECTPEHCIVEAHGMRREL